MAAWVTFFRVEVADFCFHSINPSPPPYPLAERGTGWLATTRAGRVRGSWRKRGVRFRYFRQVESIGATHLRVHIRAYVQGWSGARAPTVCYDALDWVRLSTPLSPIPRAARSQRTLGVYNGEDHARIPGAMTYREKGIAWPLAFPPNLFSLVVSPSTLQDYSPI